MKIVETTAVSLGSIDREAKVIRGVKILGAKSKNGRTYSPEAMQKLKPLYEKKAVNLDHDRKNPIRERGISEQFGILTNIRCEQDGVFGDLPYFTKHPLCELVLERAEDHPDSFGLSHVADGTVKFRKGVPVVEDVKQVFSVDLVQDPATTAGLFESFEVTGERIEVMQFAEIVELDHPVAKLLKEQMEEAAIEPTMDVEAPAEASPEQKIKEGFKSAILAILDEDIDLGEKVTRIRKLLKAEESVTKAGSADDGSGDAGDGDGDSDGDDDEKVAESLEREKAKNAQLTAKNLLLESGRCAHPERISAVAGVTDQKLQKKLLESWPQDLSGTDATGRPGTSPPSRTSEQVDPQYRKRWEKAIGKS